MKLFLIQSNSKFLLEQEITNIIKKSTNQTHLSYPEYSISDILEEASYISLFPEEKFVIVKNADFFGKGKISEKDSEKLLQYFSNPASQTTLIFTTYEEIDKRKTITKKIEEIGGLFVFLAPKNYDLFLDTKKKMSKYKTEDTVIRYMIDACLSSYDILQNEINKLSLFFHENDKISLSEIKKIISSNVNDNVFRFVDSVIAKDGITMFRMLEDFIAIKLDVLQLINLLAREYRLIYYYKILEKKHIALKEMMSELKLQEWQLDKIRKEASLYHCDDLKDYLVKIALLDVKMKSGQYDKNTAFQEFLVEVLEY